MMYRYFLHRSTGSALRPTVLTVALGLLMSAGAVSAQESPYFLSAKQTFLHDNNIGRRAPGSQVADTISSTGLQAGVDQPIGQQRVSLNADVTANRYSKYDLLNYTSFGASGRLDWATIENISGSASLSTHQGMNTLPSAVATASPTKNLQRVNGYSFDIRKGGVTFLTLDAGLSGSQVSYSDPATTNRNVRQQTFTTGVKIQPSPILSSRLGIRHSNATYPNYSVASSDTVKRNDLDLSATYELSGLSSVNGRISYTQEAHSTQGLRDMNGLTGAFGLTWTPTGKLSLNATMGRDTRVGSLEQFGTINVLNTATDASIRDYINLKGTWDFSAFLRLDGTLGYSRRTVDNSFFTTAGSGTSGGKDHTISAGLGLVYTPIRNVAFGCGLNWENRSVDSQFGASAVTFGYSDTSANCYGQVYLR